MPRIESSCLQPTSGCGVTVPSQSTWLPAPMLFASVVVLCSSNPGTSSKHVIESLKFARQVRTPSSHTKLSNSSHDEKKSVGSSIPSSFDLGSVIPKKSSDPRQLIVDIRSTSRNHGRARSTSRVSACCDMRPGGGGDIDKPERDSA